MFSMVWGVPHYLDRKAVYLRCFQRWALEYHMLTSVWPFALAWWLYDDKGQAPRRIGARIRLRLAWTMMQGSHGLCFGATWRNYWTQNICSDHYIVHFRTSVYRNSYTHISSCSSDVQWKYCQWLCFYHLCWYQFYSISRDWYTRQ